MSGRRPSWSSLFWLTSAVGLLVIAAVVCGGPELVKRKCTPAGECLPGYRCRSPYCVPLAPEVCDGEDNNGDGFVDESLYRAAVRSIVAPSRAGFADDGGTTPPPPFHLAWNGSHYLAAWVEASEPSPHGYRVRYVLLDGRGDPAGSLQTAASFESDLEVKLAAASAPSSFLIAYSGEAAPRVMLKLVRVDPQGQASAPEILNDAGFLPEKLLVGWALGEPLATVLHEPNRGGILCGATVTCEPRGLFVGRAGRTAERVSGGAGYLVDIALAGTDQALAVAWTECVPPADGGPWWVSNVLGQMECARENSRATVRRTTGGDWGTYNFEGAKALALAFVGGDLVAAWHDVREATRPRVLATRVPAPGQASGEETLVSERAAAAAGLSLTGTPSEAAVVWDTYFQPALRFDTYFARVDPRRGRIGSETLLRGQSQLKPDLGSQGFFDGQGYAVWLGQEQPRLAEIRCSDGPPEGEPDAGGSFPDAGPVPDGGPPPDGGSVPACSAGATDGGQLLEGRVGWLGGIPAAGLQVLAGTCLTQTDSEGRFRASGVTVPYDLTVLVPMAENIAAWSYAEVQTTAPTVQLPVVDGPLHQTYFAGSYDCDGGTRLGVLYLICPGVAYSSTFSITCGSFEHVVSWRGSSALATQAILFGRGETYWPFVSARYFPSLTVEDSARVELGAVVPEPLFSREVSVSLPSGASLLEGGDLMLTLGGEQIELGSLAFAGTVQAPVLGEQIPGILHLLLTVSHGAGVALISTAAIGPSDTVVPVEVPPSPQLAGALTDGGSGQPAAIPFAPAPGAGHHFAILVPQGPREGLIQHVLVAAASPLRVVDLRPLGLGWPPGTPVGFRVYAHLDGPSFEAILAGARLWGPGRFLAPGQAISMSEVGWFTP